MKELLTLEGKPDIALTRSEIVGVHRFIQALDVWFRQEYFCELAEDYRNKEHHGNEGDQADGYPMGDF